MEPLDAVLRDLIHPRVGTRVRAVRALIRQPDPRALAPLLHALSDEDGRVRNEAVRALGKLGAAAVQPLCEVMRDGDPRAYLRALEAVALTGVPESIPVLLQAMLEIEPEYAPMDMLGKALARIGVITVPPLCGLLRRPERTRRDQALELLLRIAAENPGPELRAALPVLQQRLRERSVGREEREQLFGAIATIKAVTAVTRDLPLAAKAPQDEPQPLPIPAEAPAR
jgi:HEAT repeat protein